MLQTLFPHRTDRFYMISTILNGEKVYTLMVFLQRILSIQFLFSALFSVLTLASVGAAHAEREVWYQKVWCDGIAGRMEVKLPEGPRVDCLTQYHAIEMDFANKWHEAIGQSLHYAQLTGQKAGIVLILRSHGDKHHLDAARKIIKAYNLPITLWTLGP